VFGDYTNETYGFPQTLMMLDIAALQQMYGADFNTNSGNTTYSFSSTTGEMSINGVGQGTPGANRLFLTIWDGGGDDYYDFSSYSTNLNVNLNPGAWSVTSSVQRANLGFSNFAAGNVYNALQYQGDARSLIENALGGTGNDIILGNVANNVLNGSNGNDTLDGGVGRDTLIGGSGTDTVSFASSAASVQLVLYDLNYNTGDAVGDGYVSIEIYEGSTHTDILVGDFLANDLRGGGGGDWLDGTYGGDALYGQAGNDSLVSRQQADVLDGGADFDYARYDYADAALRAYLYDPTQNTGWAAGDTLISIEGLAGSYFDDDLRGDAGQNIIYGLGGADYMIGLGDSDLLIGGDGQDLFHFVGIGDGGPGGDVITDFVSGFDRISVTGAFFGLGSPGGVAIDSWRFVAGTAATMATSQFIYDSATQQVFYDYDGTGAADKVLLATLQAGATLAAGDIIVI
jgi:serralysin